MDIPLPARTLPHRLVENARVLPSRDDILPLLPKQRVFCEVGVAFGDFSQKVIAQCDVDRFIAIDIFTMHNYPEMWGGQVGKVLAGRDHAEFYADRFRDEINRGVVQMMEGNSIEMLSMLEDRSADIFYIDAHHDFESVSAELAIVERKIADDGCIILNDYIMHDYTTGTPYGVIRATNDFMIEKGWEMIYFALHSGMYCDVVIRRLR